MFAAFFLLAPIFDRRPVSRTQSFLRFFSVSRWPPVGRRAAFFFPKADWISRRKKKSRRQWGKKKEPHKEKEDSFGPVRRRGMGNRQVKAPFDVRDNIRIYHQHVRGKTVAQELRKKHLCKLKNDLYKSQFGAEPLADVEFKLVWFIIDGGGRVPIVVTPTSPTLSEIEQKITPTRTTGPIAKAIEYPLRGTKVLAKGGDAARWRRE